MISGLNAKLEAEIKEALNRACAEADSNTPDFILAKYLLNCLAAWNVGVKARDAWYGIAPRPGREAAHDET